MTITNQSKVFVGTVLSWASTSSSLVLGANAAVASTGASDVLNFSGDDVIVTWLRRLDDPRTLTIDLSLGGVSEGLTYLTDTGLLADGRMSQVLAGFQP